MNVDEPPPLPAEDGPGYAHRMAMLKAAAAVEQVLASTGASDRPGGSGYPSGLADPGDDRPTHYVLTADTAVDVAREVLGKPLDRADAVRMLEKLSGTTHRVCTGYCLSKIPPGGEPTFEHGVESAVVTFRDLTREEIEAYVDTGEAFGKAGAYAIQLGADRFVSSLEGEFATVVGLPLARVAEMLERTGFTIAPIG